MFLDVAIDELANGKRLDLPAIGTFDVHLRPHYNALDPRTLEGIHVPPKRVVRFKIANSLRARIDAFNGGGEAPPDQQGDAFEDWCSGRVPLRRFGYGEDQVQAQSSKTQLDNIVDRLEELGARSEVEQALHLLLDDIATLLVTGARFELREFGVFETQERASRPQRMPSGEIVVVPSRRVIKFKPGRLLRERVDECQIKLWPPSPEQLESSCTLLKAQAGSQLTDLTDLRELASLTHVTYLYVGNADSLKSLDGLETLTSLETLVLAGCSTLTDVRALGSMPSLKYLLLSGCSSLTTLQGLEGCSSLASLTLYNCSSLTDLGALGSMPSLTYLRLSECSSLTTLQGLEGCSSLASLTLSYCSSLTDLGALQALTSLESLSLWGCSSLPNELQTFFGSSPGQKPMEQFWAAFTKWQG